MDHHRASSRTVFMLVRESSDTFFVLETTHVANAGLTFGVLEDAPFHVPTVLFMIGSAIGLGMVLWVLKRTAPSELVLRLGALVGGAGMIGNLIDRLRLGYVIDWIGLRWNVFGWRFEVPTFNIADLLICAGIVVIAAILGKRWLTSRAHS